jgi:chromosome segregation ATPase
MSILNNNNEVRFAKGSNAGWKPKQEEYRLAPNQLKAYLSGTSMEEAREIEPIWENGEPEEAPVAAVKEMPRVESKEDDSVVESDQGKSLTPELYRKHKEKALTDKEIMDQYEINNVQLSLWKKKHFSPEEIKEMRKSRSKDPQVSPKNVNTDLAEKKDAASGNLQETLNVVKIELDEARKTIDNQEKEIGSLIGERLQLKTQLNVALEELKSGQPASSYSEVKINQLKAEVNNLKREIKMYQDEEIMNKESKKVKESQSELIQENENLKKEVIDAHKLVTEIEKKFEHLKESFETAMNSKGLLHKENNSLMNKIDSLTKKLQASEDTNIRFNLDYLKLEEETVALRKYAAIKTRNDLETVQ